MRGFHEEVLEEGDSARNAVGGCARQSCPKQDCSEECARRCVEQSFVMCLGSTDASFFTNAFGLLKASVGRRLVHVATRG